MTRPSKNLDRKMIEASKRIIVEEGVDRLTVRHICEVSDVNMGMFHYHFSSKSNFYVRLIESIYDEFYEFLKIDCVRESRDSLARLRYCLSKMMEFSRNKESLFASLFFEIILKDDDLMREIRKNIERKHILFQLIEECKTNGIFKTILPTSDIFAMFFLVSIRRFVFDRMYDISDGNDHEDLRRERIEIILRGLLSDKHNIDDGE